MVTLRLLVLVLGVALGAPAARAATAKAPAAKAKASAAKKPARPRKPPPPVVLYHVNRRETLTLRLRDDRGRPIPGMARRLNRFLRCHHTNKQGRMHPRLIRLLHEIGRHYPGKRVEIVSGYRAKKVARNPKSPHMKGLACDLRVAGVKNTELRDYLRAHLTNVGVGYYPNSSFVHLDVREGPSAFWVDYSRPKEDAVYAEDPIEALKQEREGGPPSPVTDLGIGARSDEAREYRAAEHRPTQGGSP